MKIGTTLRLAACAALSLGLAGRASAQSDSCAGATPIAPGTYTGSTAGATADGHCECAPDSPDVWYSYTPASSGVLVLDTCGTVWDTVLSVHTGCPAHLGNQVACNDDANCGGDGAQIQSRLTVPVEAGTTYRIRISGFLNATGPYTLHVAFIPPVASDTCEGAVPVGPGTYTGTTVGATWEDNTTCWFGPPGPDVWYAYTASAYGSLRVDTCGSSFDTMMSIREECSDTETWCNDDSCPMDGGSAVGVNVVPGRTYHFRIAGFFGGSGQYVMHVSFQPEVGQVCYQAPLVHAGTYTGTTDDASRDGETTCGTSDLSPDVWYRYAAGITGTATLSTCGSFYDTVVSVHSSCPGNDLNTVRCNDDAACGGPDPQRQSRVSFPVVAGESYWVRMSGYNMANGWYVLTITETGCRADWNHDGTVNSSDISAFLTTWLASVSGGTLAADFNADATVNSSDISAMLTAWLAAVQGGC